MADWLISTKQKVALQKLQDNETTEIFYGGGAGGGKSMLGCYWGIKRRLKYPGTRGVIGRKNLAVLKESTLVTFFKVCNMLGLVNRYHYRYDGKRHITWYNGSQTILVDLFYYPSDPDFNSLGSTEYTDGFIDEAPDITLKAFEILNSRMRHMIDDYNLVPKMLLTGNPSNNWVKQRYVKDKEGNMIQLEKHQFRIQATLADNPDPRFRASYLRQLDRMSSEYDKARLRDGDWDAEERTGAEFYPNFDPKIHMGLALYDPTLPIHITFDMNVVPYMTCIVCQLVRSEDFITVKVINEFCMPHPLNTTRQTARHACQYFQRLGHTAGAFVYGDYTKKSRSTGLPEQYNNEYDIVFEELRPLLTSGYDRVIPNANAISRRNLIDDALIGEIPVRLLISDKCYQTKDEFMKLKQDKDGLKWKETVKDPLSKVTYEKIGHISDALEYLFSSAFKMYMNRK